MSPGRLRALVAEERGFSLIVALMVLASVTILMYTAFNAVDGSSGTTRLDLDQKRALAAAYAGLSAYTEQLNANSNFWASCPSAGATGLTGTTGVTVPGSTDDGSTETYSYLELPASSEPTTDGSTCDTSDPIASEIEANDTAAGTFRVKFTGTSGPTTGTAQHTSVRSIVAQFEPNRFLNYVYFTNYEEVDPVAENPASPDYQDCDQYLAPEGHRDSSKCPGIEFAPTDDVAGPLHSNDVVEYCGGTSNGTQGPIFGRSGDDDAIQAYSFTADSSNSCSGAPQTYGQSLQTFASGQWKFLQLPPSDGQLLEVADGGNSADTNGCYANAGCVFTGPTQIALNGSSMTVTNSSLPGSPMQYSLSTYPSNGVIYVLDGTGACAAYTPFGTDYSTSDNAGCGDATVSGSYNDSLTIGADNDVIINGNITTTLTSNNVLGLIANGFVRVAHPVTGSCDNNSTNTTSGIYSTLTNPTIDAAILAVGNSFIVDNYSCGATLGTLTVNGAIAQDYRGPVGTLNNGSINHGYSKAYTYDERFQSLSPPYFLNPVDAGWQVQRVTECGTKC